VYLLHLCATDFTRETTDDSLAYASDHDFRHATYGRRVTLLQRPGHSLLPRERAGREQPAEIPRPSG
jgi:hypothetical protein